MHLPPRRLRRVLSGLAGLSLAALAWAPAVPAAAAPWGSVLVRGCDWAAAAPGGVCTDLDVHSNGSDFGYYNGDSGYGYQWQCVEMAQRWARLAYGETYRGGNHWGVNAAYQMWGTWSPGNADQANYSVPFAQHPNGGASAPQFGDLVIWAPTSGNPYGHVSVVSGTEVGYVDIVEENWSDTAGGARLPISGTTLADRGSYHAYGWLRAGNAHTIRSLGRTPAHAWSGPFTAGKLRVGLLGGDQGVGVLDGSGATYSSPQQLGGQLLTAPTEVQDSAGQLELFATRTDHAVGRYAPSNAAATSFAWSTLGGNVLGKPAVLRASDGHLEVYVRGTDQAIWRRYQLTPGGTWSGWNSIGGQVLSDAAVVALPGNGVALYTVATDRAVWEWLSRSGQGGNWNSMGGLAAGAPQVVLAPSGQLGMYVVGTDDQVYYRSGTPGMAFAGWAGLGGVLVGDPTVALSTSGLPVVLAVGTDGGLWIDRLGSTRWSGWSTAGGTLVSDVSAQRDAAGLLEVFGLGSDNILYNTVEATPDGAFGHWNELGSTWQVP